MDDLQLRTKPWPPEHRAESGKPLLFRHELLRTCIEVKARGPRKRPGMGEEWLMFAAV